MRGRRSLQTDHSNQALNTDALYIAIASKYAVEVHNRYSVLQNLDPGDQNIGDAWETSTCAIRE